MPEPLKNMFSRPLLENFSQQVSAVWPAFDQAGFLERVFDASWAQRELKQRMRHIAESLRAGLPPGYPAALDVVTGVAEQWLRARGEGMKFEYCFVPDFVEVFGLDDPDRSVPALAVVTRWCSAEFAVRPFLLLHVQLRQFSLAAIESFGTQYFDWEGQCCYFYSNKEALFQVCRVL